MRSAVTPVPTVICLVGPTGTGKTEAALTLAEGLGGAVVNFDSRQIFEGLPLITAQPTPEERARCPHLLYGAVPLCARVNAQEFVAMAAEALAETHRMGRVPILTGGTGMYLRSLLHGLAPVPDIPEDVRQAVLADIAARGPAALHAQLAEVDPATATRLHPHDRQRIARALEVWRGTGRTLAWWHEQPGQPPARSQIALKLGSTLPLDDLLPRLAARIQAMLAAGALAEMRAALDACPDEAAQAYSSIGCRELIAHLRGRTSLDEAVALWLKHTRAYAKRQITWFRADPDVTWFSPGEGAAMLALARQRLAAAS